MRNLTRRTALAVAGTALAVTPALATGAAFSDNPSLKVTPALAVLIAEHDALWERTRELSRAADRVKDREEGERLWRECRDVAHQSLSVLWQVLEFEPQTVGDFIAQLERFNRRAQHSEIEPAEWTFLSRAPDDVRRMVRAS